MHSVSCVLLLVSAVACVQIPFRRVERAKRESDLSKHVASTSSMQDYSVQYIGEIQIGTPPQTFAVEIDPTVSLLWVLDSSYRYCSQFECAVQLQPCPGYCRDTVFCKNLCETSCCNGSGATKSTFKSSASSTYHKNGTAYNLLVDNIQGFYGTDKVQVGDLSVGRAYFGQTTLLNPYFDYVPADGVLGLAYHLSYIGEDAVKPFIQQLIESGALGEPVFTVYMSNKKDLEVAGTITYGDFDDDRCERPAIYAHIGVGYDFKAGYVKIGSTLLQPVNATSVTITTFFTDDYVIVPVEHIDAVVDAFGAVYNRTSGEITVQCDAKLPSIGISLGGQQLAVSSDALISDKPSVDGMCDLKILSDDALHDWYLGRVLARSYCQVFDLGKSRVGFGKAK